MTDGPEELAVPAEATAPDQVRDPVVQVDHVVVDAVVDQRDLDHEDSLDQDEAAVRAAEQQGEVERRLDDGVGAPHVFPP